MARYKPKHRKKRKLFDRRAGSFVAVLLTGVASFSGSFGYVPGAAAIDPTQSLSPTANPTVERLAAGSVLRPQAVVVPAIEAESATLPGSFFIPAIGAGGDLIDLGKEVDGTLEVPVDFNEVGWYTGSPRPGEVGASVLAGHVDSHIGPAIFKHLNKLKPGDEVRVSRRDGKRLQFLVTRIDRYPKEFFPTSLVYGPTTAPELRLITCGGTFDRKSASYDSNVVVYATLATA
jgi:hypothetical protein